MKERQVLREDLGREALPWQELQALALPGHEVLPAEPQNPPLGLQVELREAQRASLWSQDLFLALYRNLQESQSFLEAVKMALSLVQAGLHLGQSELCLMQEGLYRVQMELYLLQENLYPAQMSLYVVQEGL